MTFSDYCGDRRRVLLVCLAGGLFFSVLLTLWGIGTAELTLLWICFAGIVAAALFCGYVHQKKRMQYLLSFLDSLDQKYLFAEIADRPESTLEGIYFRLMKTAMKAMTDEVNQSRRLSGEYREFIEQWVHEIKVPITGIRLLCENHKGESTRKIMAQAELIEQDVERVLFYARLGNVEKDYLIKEVRLRDCVMEVLARDKQLLIQNGFCVHAESVPHIVYSDEKWINFILNQIIINSVKYRRGCPAVIDITSVDLGNHVSLSVTDNGIGIRQSEISRVFDKGFVGSNGRAEKTATGMGLYLCRQLCGRLGIEIAIESAVGQSTTVCLLFPKSDHWKV